MSGDDGEEVKRMALLRSSKITTTKSKTKPKPKCRPGEGEGGEERVGIVASRRRGGKKKR